MPAPIYFQWQNDVLKETIYTSRERKLTDFLVFYKEVDLWKQYKDQKIESIQGDVRQYIADREKTTRDSYQSYRRLYDYFMKGDVRAKYASRTTDEKDLASVLTLHKTFADSLPKISDVSKEKFFVTRMLVEWEAYIKKLETDIKAKRRRVAIVLNEQTKKIEMQALEKLENVISKLANDEWMELRAFVSSFNKIEKRKLELSNLKKSAQTGIKGARTRLTLLRTQLETADAKQRELTAALERLKAPPSVSALQGYFMTDEVPGHTRSPFPKADPTVMSTLQGMRKKLASDLRALKDDVVKQVTIKNLIYPLQEQQTKLKREITVVQGQLEALAADAPNRAERQGRLDALRDAQKAVEAEIDKVTEFQSAVDYSKKTPVELAQLKQAKEKELLLAQQRRSQLAKDAADAEAQIKSFESILSRDEEEYLVRYTPDQPITVKDIVRSKSESYAASLVNKNQYELLELIIARFVAEPGRYPLWLQYMVIHFSGMRYASAHGSWADPRDLLSSLLTPKLEKRFKTYDDSIIQAMSEQRAALYETPGVLGPDAPKLAGATDARSKERIARHVKGLKSLLPHQRRKALYDLLLDEQEYEIELMKPEEVLNEIKEIGAQDNFPAWMWTEIKRLTELRIQEVTSKEWEKLTPEELEQRNDAKYAEYRTLMNKWKEQNLTGWREEHDKSNRLIVTRSVCNEVAEQIQHLRGITPPGGLTSKAPWYMNQERNWKGTGEPKPYFRKPKSISDYKVGASILWLKFVNEMPNPWRVAHPLKTTQGDELIPAAYLQKTATDDWTYSQGDVVKRVRTRVTPTKQNVRDEQWLRWIHEATVADIMDTVDGQFVLTFETALPYDDPRISTIGVFKRSLNDLLYFDGGEEYFNGSFVGYLPEGKLPMDDLAEMLDWNKILLKQYTPPA